uniref:Chemokine interleukin-8-like domain-containing protein n=1 Tax=Xiphophorus couchianus TaxID=32473 RepID=A0A3B5MEY6_9TELE
MNAKPNIKCAQTRAGKIRNESSAYRSVVGNQVVNLRCRCITKERKPIGRRIVALEVHPVSSHCAEIQIIATLKMEKRKVCLDPKAPWVQKVLKNRRAR